MGPLRVGVGSLEICTNAWRLRLVERKRFLDDIRTFVVPGGEFSAVPGGCVPPGLDFSVDFDFVGFYRLRP